MGERGFGGEVGVRGGLEDDGLGAVPDQVDAAAVAHAERAVDLQHGALDFGADGLGVRLAGGQRRVAHRRMELHGAGGCARGGVVPAGVRHDLHRRQRERIPARADNGNGQFDAFDPLLCQRAVGKLQGLVQRFGKLLGVLHAANALGGAGACGFHTQRIAAGNTAFHLGQHRFGTPCSERAARQRQRLRRNRGGHVFRKVVVRLQRFGKARLVVGAAAHGRAATHAWHVGGFKGVLDVAGFAVRSAQAVDGHIGLGTQKRVHQAAVNHNKFRLVFCFFQRCDNVIRRDDRTLRFERPPS